MWLDDEVTAPPSGFPITIEEARAQCSVEADCTDYDTELNIYIAAAAGHAEAITGTRLLTQTVLLRASCWGDLYRLPLAPIATIASIKYLDGDDVEQTLATSVYEPVLVGLRPLVRLKAGQAWPAHLGTRDAIRVAADVGYGAAAAQPAAAKLAQLLMIGEWFKNRETSTAIDTTAVPNGARSLLGGHRRARGL